jgi:hypothetical protein
MLLPTEDGNGIDERLNVSREDVSKWDIPPQTEAVRRRMS